MDSVQERRYLFEMFTLEDVEHAEAALERFSSKNIHERLFQRADTELSIKAGNWRSCLFLL